MRSLPFICVSVLAIASGCAPVGDFELAGPIDGETTSAVSDAQLSSRYALAMNVKTISRAKDDGKTKDTTYRIDGIVTAQQTDQRVALTVQMCQMVFPAIKGYTLQYDKALVARSAPVTLEGTIDGNNDLQTRAAAWELGTKLGDPLHDGLPSNPTDPRIVDIDKDGNPGFSVSVKGFGAFQVYLALRGIFSLRAALPPAGTAIVGDAKFMPDWTVFGDTIPFKDAKQLSDEAVAKYDLLDGGVSLRMEPVANDATCAAATAVQP